MDNRTTLSRLSSGRPSRRNDGEWAADSIRGLICRGQLRAGERVVPEDMADALGVSRTPVREGMVTLECEGVVVVEPQRGTRVTGFSPRIVRDHYEISGLVLGRALQWALERAPEAALRALEGSVSQAATGADWRTVAETMEEFRGSVLTASGSVRAASVLRVLPDLSVPLLSVSDDSASPTVDVLRHLRALIRAGQAADSRDVLDETQELYRSLGRHVLRLLEATGAVVPEAAVLQWPVPASTEVRPEQSLRPASFARARTPGSGRVEALLRDRIVHLEIPPGARVDLKELAQLAGVSTTPLREAMISLEAQGLVRIEPHRGVFVNPFSARDASDHYQLFAALFAFATRRLIEAQDQAALSELRQISQALDLTHRSDAFERHNRRFLDHLIRQADSRPLVVALRATPEVMTGNFFQRVPGAQQNHRAGTAAILAAAQRGDLELASAWWSKMLAADAQGVIAALGIS